MTAAKALPNMILEDSMGKTLLPQASSDATMQSAVQRVHAAHASTHA
jgi:hypothetical protein